MTPLRFRAWDKSTKQMLPTDFTMRFAENGLAYFKRGGTEYSLDAVEIMQSTGLTDKNGKTIFEGDVVTKDGKVNAEVIFYEGAFRVKLLVPIQINSLQGYGFADGGTELQEHWAELDSDCSVVGNKFENPELLPPTE